MRKSLSSVLVILFIVIADQALKYWVKTNMVLGEEIPVWGNWFIIHFVENNGMAFGYEFAGDYGKYFLSIFRVAAVIVISYYLIRFCKRGDVPLGLILSISLILAGAVGNIIDSAFYGLIFSDSSTQVATLFPEGGGYGAFLKGRVVDMFYFPLIKGYYPSWIPYVGGDSFIFFRPVFNIADSAISVGVFVILIFYRRSLDHLYNLYRTRRNSTA